MNFETICQNCGALSSPVVGVCPYCKSVMSSEGETQNPSMTRIKNLFSEGNIDEALVAANALETKNPDAVNNANFTLLYAQILLEVDGPSSKIKSVLNRTLLETPSDPRLLEYLEIVEAESHLSHDKDDAGEVALVNIVRRSPENAHALFLLGSHWCWVEGDAQRAVSYLERCVKLRPNFLRAKACLAAVYKKLGIKNQAEKLLNECAAKTSDPGMKAFFRDFVKSR